MLFLISLNLYIAIAIYTAFKLKDNTVTHGVLDSAIVSLFWPVIYIAAAVLWVVLNLLGNVHDDQ